MDCQHISDREILQRGLVVANKIHSLLGNYRPPQPLTHHKASAIPPITLSIPEGIVQSLIHGGCPPSSAQSLSDAFVQSAYRIRAKWESLHRQTCQEWASSLASDPDSLHTIIQLGPVVERHYRDQIRTAEKLVMDRVHMLSQQAGDMRSSRVKPSFNQDFVPVLEKYFEYNPYPPAADRALLAGKSMMTSRQIEVWFQNHRNRARKEGKVLQRNSLDLLPSNISLESLEKSIPFFVIPEKERKGTFNRKSVNDTVSNKEPATVAQPEAPITFSSSTPPHAFPTRYPPCCNYDPFPVRTGSHRFPPPEWPRKPATSQPATTSINFEEFTQDFAMKLNLREPGSRKQRQNVDVHGPSLTPWFAATYTVAPPAPHPALVRSPPLTRLAPSSPFHAVPAPANRHPFRSPSPYAQLATLVPPQQNRTPVQRKVARLPNRTPKHPPLSRRRGSPSMSEASPAPSARSPTPNSRSSSFGSDISLQNSPWSPGRRPSSSSSSSSSSSPSTPTTPESLHAALPDDVRSPVSVSGLDFRYLDNLFDNSMETASTIKGLPPTFLTPDQLKGTSGFSFSFGVPHAD